MMFAARLLFRGETIGVPGR